MLHFWTVFILQAYALQRTDLPCDDQELSDQCLKNCRENYISCLANCESTYCNSECLQVYQDCDAACPCGIDCPGGCANCSHHELCQARCENAHENNDEYRLCFYDALFEHNLCLKECPASAACHELCFEIYSDKMATCPCMETQTISTTVATTTETTTTSTELTTSTSTTAATIAQTTSTSTATTTTTEETTTTTTTTTEISTTTTTTKELTPIDESEVSILVILEYLSASYLTSGDGSTNVAAKITAPSNDYTRYAKHALVNGQIHIFGGRTDARKIAKLDGCAFVELSARLRVDRDQHSEELSIESGTQALVCFNYAQSKTCEIFDGSTATTTFATSNTHNVGGLGLYKKQPTTVGCFRDSHKKAETLTSTGWAALPDHPQALHGHSSIGLDDNSMLLLGGRIGTTYQTGIWQIKENVWSRIGELTQSVAFGSAFYNGRSIFHFAGNSSPYPNHRIDLTENEEIKEVVRISNQPGRYLYPVLLQTTNDRCV